MNKIIVLGSSAATPFPRTRSDRFEDYKNFDYIGKFDLHNDPICASAKKGGKDRRTRACLALIWEERTILFNAGPDIVFQLKKFNLKPDAVFINHAHSDAAAGLKYLDPEVKVFSEDGALRPGKMVNVLGVGVMPFRVQHSEKVKTIGFRVKMRGFEFAYMSDISSLAGARQHISDCDLVFSDGSMLAKSGAGHLAIDKQLAIFKRWQVKKIIFTHIGHATLPHDDLVKYVKDRYFNADVAYDGMIINLFFSQL